VLWVGVTLYAVFGGADFGAGFWDLLAARERDATRPRALMDRAVAPVWEANHVWLIFCLVVLWTGFPEAFAAVMTTLFVPLTLAAVGIVLRGTGFALRKPAASLLGGGVYETLFSVSSVVTPFFMGTVVGAIVSGRVPAEGGGDQLTTWLNLTSVAIGLLFVASCAYIAAVFLVYDARRARQPDLVRYFTRRAFVAGAAAGALAVAGLVCRADLGLGSGPVSRPAARLADALRGGGTGADHDHPAGRLRRRPADRRPRPGPALLAAPAQPAGKRGRDRIAIVTPARITIAIGAVILVVVVLLLTGVIGGDDEEEETEIAPVEISAGALA
jgi:hypothetical protein